MILNELIYVINIQVKAVQTCSDCRRYIIIVIILNQVWEIAFILAYARLLSVLHPWTICTLYHKGLDCFLHVTDLVLFDSELASCGELRIIKIQ